MVRHPAKRLRCAVPSKGMKLMHAISKSTDRSEPATATKRRKGLWTVLAASAALLAVATAPADDAKAASCAPVNPASIVVHYHTVKIDGVDIFYREAGPSGAPNILLLHGFPT